MITAVGRFSLQPPDLAPVGRQSTDGPAGRIQLAVPMCWAGFALPAFPVWFSCAHTERSLK